MDKLKYIKLELADGSYTNSIPIAVDADQVSTSGGSNLATDLVQINNTNSAQQTQINNLATDLVQINNTNSAQQTQINNLQSEVDGYDASWIFTSTPSVADFNAFYNYVDNGGIRVYFTSQNDDNEINTTLVENVTIGETGDEKYIRIYRAGGLVQLDCDGTKVTKKVVPTNISSFTNDSNYQTATQVQTAINNAIGTALGGSY